LGDVLDSISDHLAKLSGEFGKSLESKRARDGRNIGKWLKSRRKLLILAIIEENRRGERRRARRRNQRRNNVRLGVGDVGRVRRNSLSR
jgi:hypothetical protein